MRRLLLVLALSLMMPMLSGATYYSPVGYAKENYWFCKSIGHTEDEKIVALSEVFTAGPETEYADIEEAYSDIVHDQIEEYTEAVPARCTDYESSDLANKHREHQKHLAKQHKYVVRDISLIQTND